jgi:protein-S-isoprenylcysteine O-methyltransferase Ste14
LESLFRIAFWLIFGGMVVMQAYFSYRLHILKEHKPAEPQELRREGRWPSIVRVVRSTLLVVFLVLYALGNPWLRTLSLPFYGWVRATGIIMGTLSLMLYAWSRLTIGRAWSSPLRMQEKHQLVTTGPYAVVRHPIYLSMILFMTGITLVTGNWFLIAFLLISFVDLMVRIPKEERMMIEEFGKEYDEYRLRTGKLLPK